MDGYVSFAKFLNVFGASKSLVEEVQEEERKLNLEFSILGEFVRKWAEFERALSRKCNDLSSKEVSQRFLSIGKMLDILITHEAISKHFYNIAREISIIRNKIVHGQTDFSEQIIIDALESLDELMDEL